MSGFTLVDLMLVLAILAILAAVPAVALQSDELVLEGATRELIAELAEAQSLALELQIPLGLRFETANDRYFFILDSGKTPQEEEAALRSGGLLDPHEVDRLLEAAGSGTYLDGATLESAVFGSGADVIFQIDGSPDLPGSIDLQAKSFQRRVYIRPATGRITVTVP